MAAPDQHETRKQLDRIRIVAAIDLVLLIVLLFCTATDRRGGVSVIGPIHGVIFLGLLYLTAKGAGEERWRWWFPVTTIVPLFSLIGDARIRRALDAGVARP
jgi:hypothetical protein